MGRNKTLLKGKPLPLTVSQAMLDYLKEAVSTGLYGRNVSDAAERLVAQGLDRLIEERKIGPSRRYQIDEDVDEREDTGES